MDELEMAMLVQAAADCPHYITKARADKGHTRCLGCAVRRVKPRDQWVTDPGDESMVWPAALEDAA